MDEARSHRSFLIILILILLIHGIVLWIFFITSFHHASHKDLPPSASESPEKQHVLPKSTPWKALQSKPSAPVFFKNIPTHAPQTQNDAPKESSQEAETPVEPTPQSEPKKNQFEKSLITDSRGRIPFSENKEEKEQNVDQKETNKPLEVSQPKLVEKVTINPESEQSQKASEQPQKKFSFNTLAQGFANHMHGQGADSYTMRGAEKGKATAEQLRYAQYGSKICGTLTNAFVTNKHKVLFTHYAKRDVVVKISINKDGSLKDVAIVKSSTVPSIDLSIITIIKEASQSFPPVPEFFKMEVFPFTVLFNDALQIIEHPEQSYWSL